MGCELLNGFSLLVQVGLALGSFSSLVYKRHCERPQRKLRIWLFDTSKQALSAGLVHLMNMAIAQVVGANPNAESQDPCVIYTVNLFFDVAVGTLISYHLLLLAERALLRIANCSCCCASAAIWARTTASTGQYGNPPRLGRWLPQLLLWVLVVCVSKALCAAVALRTRLVMDLGTLLLQPLAPNPKAELVVVMLVAPLVLSVLQLWVQDNFLKLRSKRARPATYAPLYRCPVVEMHGAADDEQQPSPVEPRPFLNGHLEQTETVLHAQLCGLGLSLVHGASAEAHELAQPPTAWDDGCRAADGESSGALELRRAGALAGGDEETPLRCPGQAEGPPSPAAAAERRAQWPAETGSPAADAAGFEAADGTASSLGGRIHDSPSAHQTQSHHDPQGQAHLKHDSHCTDGDAAHPGGSQSPSRRQSR